LGFGGGVFISYLIFKSYEERFISEAKGSAIGGVEEENRFLEKRYSSITSSNFLSLVLFNRQYCIFDGKKAGGCI
jgi:hypothetical protein